MNEHQLTVVKEYEFDKPLNHKIDSITDKCIGDCFNKLFHTFDHICEYSIKLVNIGKTRIISLTISGKSMKLYELKKITARQRGFIFNQFKKLTIKIYSIPSNENIHYYLKLQIPIMHR